MSKRLVLIGGGHAHMVTLANLSAFCAKGYTVTVIQPSEYHYYSGMGPGMLGGTYKPEEIRFTTRRQVEAKGGRFILGKAERIDADNQVVFLEGQDAAIPYDVLSCNAGSTVPEETLTAHPPNVFTAKPIERLLLAREMIVEMGKQRKLNIAIVGSGPSAIEIAGNVRQLCHSGAVGHGADIHLFAGRSFVAGRPARVQWLIRTSLEKRGVVIHEDGRVQRIEQDRIVLSNGRDFSSDITFAAVGVRPSPIFARSELATGPDGGLLVNQYLQSSQYPNIFGGGDCIHFAPSPLDKVGVYAVRQNPVLFHNLMACLEGQALQPFRPGGAYLLIYNLGDGEGVLAKWSLSFGGKPAFSVKDWIDRRFIRTFQEKDKVI